MPSKLNASHFALVAWTAWLFGAAHWGAFVTCIVLYLLSNLFLSYSD
jgi:hypothetical protein